MTATRSSRRRGAGCTLELVPMMGDFVMRGGPLVRVQGGGARLDPDRVRQLIMLDNERTHADDAAYGFRKLVDVVQRARLIVERRHYRRAGRQPAA
jgi:uncharacterized membrane protein